MNFCIFIETLCFFSVLSYPWLAGFETPQRSQANVAGPCRAINIWVNSQIAFLLMVKQVPGPIVATRERLGIYPNVF